MNDTGSWGTLSRVPLSGGAPRPLLEEIADADWTPDGKDLAVIRNRRAGAGASSCRPGRPSTSRRRGSRCAARLAGRLERRLRRVRRDTGCCSASSTGPGRARTLAGPMAVLLRPLRLERVRPRGLCTSEGRTGRTPRFAPWTSRGASGRFTGRRVTSSSTTSSRTAGCCSSMRRACAGSCSRRAGDRPEAELAWFDGSRDPRRGRTGGRRDPVQRERRGVGGRPQAFFRKTDGSPAVRLADGEAIGSLAGRRARPPANGQRPDDRAGGRGDAGSRSRSGPVAEVATATFFPDGKGSSSTDPRRGSRPASGSSIRRLLRARSRRRACSGPPTFCRPTAARSLCLVRRHVRPRRSCRSTEGAVRTAPRDRVRRRARVDGRQPRALLPRAARVRGARSTCST